MLRFHRPLLALLAVVAALVLTAASVDARVSGSSGSRGSRTFSAPAATQTAPRAAPIERSMAQPARPGTAVGQAAGQTARPGLLGGGMFGGGLLGGLAAGFIGAGLFGMLFGHGIGGGMGGFASILGLLLQIGLVVIVARLAWTWWQRRNQPAMANGPSLRDNLSSVRPSVGGFGGFGGGTAAPADEPIEVTPADFDVFEKLLSDIQTAYGKEDLGALRAHMTPEMLSYFSEELARNASRGVVNQISDVKLLQGDLSEAWREINDDYATVAMRYSLSDKIVDRATGRVVEEEPSEATEFWTFRRAREGQWLLSAIQQT
jgi:predicted lipid-binding transport protein (Tim44 family)